MARIVEQGGGCRHSDLYSRKLRYFWLHCTWWFSNHTMLQKEPGGNTSCCLLDTGPRTLWKHWEKESHVGERGLGRYGCNFYCEKGSLIFIDVFHEYFVYMRTWVLNCIWLWGVLWLISELFNVCKLVCVTASAKYRHHQNHCITELRLQKMSSPVGTHLPFLAKCLSWVTQVFPCLPSTVQLGPELTGLLGDCLRRI